MGMFDYFRSSYYLDESFVDVICHTKDIEDYGIGGTMSQYWLSPDGQLYLIDYSHTADFVELKEGDEGYSEKYSWSNFRWIPNGTHGRVRPMYLTKYITVYPESWDGEREHWPECCIHFKDGVLQDYECSSKGEWK
jgi:hypothetical protein